MVLGHRGHLFERVEEGGAGKDLGAQRELSRALESL